MILVAQSIVLGEVKAEILVHDEDPRNDQIILQQYFQQVESLSPENRLSKLCVKGMNPAPHIHEHLQYTIMATSMRTPSRITTSRLSTLR